jgi:hypothetical protein|nr:hypothetical protein Q903MT_gene844 [Picea sitchensis]
MELWLAYFLGWLYVLRQSLILGGLMTEISQYVKEIDTGLVGLGLFVLNLSPSPHYRKGYRKGESNG